MNVTLAELLVFPTTQQSKDKCFNVIVIVFNSLRDNNRGKVEAHCTKMSFGFKNIGMHGCYPVFIVSL